MGLEGALRRQDRAAERREGRPRRSAPGELGQMAGEGTCAGCGTRVPNGDLFFAEVGSLCVGCYGEHAEPRASRLRQGLVQLAPLVPWVALVTLILWTGRVDPMGAGLLAILGGATTVQKVRHLLLRLRAEERDWGVIGAVAVAAAGWAAPTVVLVALAFASGG